MAAESLIPGTDMSDSLAFLKKAKVETAPEGIEEGIGALGKARQAEAEAIGKAEGEKAKARTAYAEAEKKAVEPIFRQREQAMKGVKLPETFAPTETNSQDLMSLFTLTGIAGMLLGRGGGKQAALGAQQAMTGMMQGYMAGRKDLYDRERQNFETNMKLMDARKREINDAFEVAFKEATTIGLSQAKTNLENKLATAGADIYLAKLRTGTIEDAYKAFSDLVKIDQETKKITANLQRKEEQATLLVAKGQDGKFYFFDRIKKDFLRDKNGNLVEATAPRTERIREQPLDKTIKYQGKLSLLDSLEKLRNDFKNDYQLGFFGLGAEMERGARARFATEESDPVVTWWANNDLLQAPERHALFGATLTGNELQNFKKFSPTETDGAATIKDKLDNQINYLKSRIKTDEKAFEMSGIKIPEKQNLNWIKSVNIDSENWSKENLEAYGWAQQHPDDPRAIKILETLGLK